MAYSSVLVGRAEPREHIVDVLIAERAPRLASSPAWPILRPALYAFLDYGKARRMADAIAPLSGQAALDFVSRLLEVKVTVQGLARIPTAGRFVAVCNHPTGIADGIAVFDALKGVRPDTVFYANSDASRVAAGFDEVLIPVEWVEEKRTRSRTRVTLVRTREAMESGRGLMIFPSGRLSRRRGGVLTDPPWAGSAFSVARKYDAPIVPMHLTGPWSTLFHFFDRFSGELRDITLFHELLNKRGKTFTLTIGRPVMPGAIASDPVIAAETMKRFVEQGLSSNADVEFDGGQI